MSTPNIEAIYLKPTMNVPNSKFPVLIYRSVLPTSASPPSVDLNTIKALFTQNDWEPQWESGMYRRSHYHSTTHEALCVFQGSARVRFGAADADIGGELMVDAVDVDIKAGDAIVIPAGVAHGCVEEKGGFKMVGAYPAGAKQWDLNYGGESVDVVEDLPASDPVVGKDDSGLCGLWSR